MKVDTNLLWFILRRDVFLIVFLGGIRQDDGQGDGNDKDQNQQTRYRFDPVIENIASQGPINAQGQSDYYYQQD